MRRGLGLTMHVHMSWHPLMPLSCTHKHTHTHTHTHLFSLCSEHAYTITHRMSRYCSSKLVAVVAAAAVVVVVVVQAPTQSPARGNVASS